MPKGRKSAGTRSAAGGQATLSFNNRVTKSSAQAQRQEQAANAMKLSQLEGTIQETEPAVAEVEVKDEAATAQQPKGEDDEESETEQIVEEEPEPSRAGAKRKVKAVKGKDEREVAAEKITDAQLRKYWQAEEDSRLAPRGTFKSLLLPLLHTLD